jgi:hypothetical protein
LLVPAAATKEEEGGRKRREGDDAREEDMRMLRYQADASATEFVPTGLARPFGAGLPPLDLT